jgi:ceramide glucosyltransferase
VWWSWLLLIAASIARTATAYNVGWLTLRDRFLFRDLWLLPLRDVLALTTWIWSYAGNSVSWRGERFRLKEGRMLPISDMQPRSGVESPNPAPAQAQRR